MRAAARVLCAGSVGTALLLVLGQAAAAPGDLDPSFGQGGLVETDMGIFSRAAAVVLQRDGKIVVGASGYSVGPKLARYLPDGRLDASFGSGGIATGPVAIAALALQPDGKILAGGSGGGVASYAVARYKPEGSLDTNFGSGGVATGPHGGGLALVLQPDGKVLLAGYSQDPNRSVADVFTLVRFDPNGALDASFGSAGVVRTAIGETAWAYGVTLQPDGKIVAAGFTGRLGYPGEHFALARYNADGSLDPTFGTTGIVTVPDPSVAYAVGVQPDGRIIAAGDGGGQMALARFNANGTLDPAFGRDGVVTTPIGSSSDARSLALQPDGRIVVAGRGPSSLALARYLPDGSLDMSFGIDGTMTTSVGTWSGANGVALQPDGKIIAAGFTDSHVLLARYLVSSPSAIEADALVVDYGHTVRVSGTLTSRQRGVPLALLKRGCYQYSARSAARVRTGSGGAWATRVRPLSRTVFQAQVKGERSARLTVQVRPRVRLVKLTPNRFQVRVLFARSLDEETAVLQRYKVSAQTWVDVKTIVLRKVSDRAGHGVSGLTFRSGTRPGQRMRILLRPGNPYDCFATAASAAIRG